MASESSSNGTPVASPSTRDAVCFTAGAAGIPFGAGVIHAHLAARRAKPAVVAGISGGALSAAALQRCYAELEKPNADPEGSRWSWFRRYLDALSIDPLNLFWDGLPDQSDFFADMPPVKDPTPSLFEDAQARKTFQELELAARRELYLYVKLGNWLAGLPLTAGRITDVIVAWVRASEQYPGLRTPRRLRLLWSGLIAFVLILYYVSLNPSWFPEHKFTHSAWKQQTKFRRPLVGWRLWGIAVVLCTAMTALFSIVLWDAAVWSITALPALLQSLWAYITSPSTHFVGDALGWLQRATAFTLFELDRRSVVWAVAVLLGIWVAKAALARATRLNSKTAYWWSSLKRRTHGLRRKFKFSGKGKELPSVVRALVRWAFSAIELEKHIVHDFHLRVRLTRLFGEGGVCPVLSREPMPAMLVTAPLQKTATSVLGGQLWARLGTPLVDALVASFAVPGLFSPLHLTGADYHNWISKDAPVPRNAAGDPELDLVDGAVIRKNPIPALFNYLARHREIAESLTSLEGRARLHVIHSHPTSGSKRDCTFTDIVDVGLRALDLKERRDTDLEVEQTNFTSRIEQEIRTRTSAKSPNVRNIFADEISPDDDAKFKNALSPSKEEVFGYVAQGCRKTLERLYANELVQIGAGHPEVTCNSLLAHVVGDGAHPNTYGLTEICAACHKKLRPSTPREHHKAPETTELLDRFPFLNGEEPRIIVLASGGVFRGPFHGGMLACLLATQIRPQMIVGASVGTLMGGALGAVLSVPDYDTSLALLGDIIDVFLHVDERIAFTKQLKSATRELGIRGRKINLSPRKIRRLVRRGTRFDPGFAAMGAPAALIDAISDLTMIPHRKTGIIASEFLAGHVSKAATLLLAELKDETLGRLGVRDAIIGASLLGPTASRLLGAQTGHINLNVQQPFERIGFFATTTSLMEEECVILGRNHLNLGKEYDFVKAALASSAFPAIFAPVRESDVCPGTGSAELLFSDGGMFDNLPYLPAISVLGQIQRQYSASRKVDPVEFLRKRHNHPDLFIVGSLDIQAQMDEGGGGPFDNLIAISKRAKLLANNVKIQAFQDLSGRIHRQLELLLDRKNRYSVPSDRAFVDGIVDAATLAVYPSDRDHLNPTFAFCRSTGFKPWRVQKSIADGCFRTFEKLVESLGPLDPASPLRRAVDGLRGEQMPDIEWSPSWAKAEQGRCPYFHHSADARASQAAHKLTLRAGPASFTCPFYEAWQRLSNTPGDEAAESAASSLAIYHECVYDESHKIAKSNADRTADAARAKREVEQPAKTVAETAPQ